MDQSENRSLFIYKGHLSIGQPKLLSLVLFTCGFLAVQRFTLSPISAAICALPLSLFVVQMLRGHHQTALTYLVLALFLSIDNGGGVYAETIAPLRYFIYMSAITMLFYLSNWRIQRKRLLLAALFCYGIAFGCVTTAFGSVPLDVSTLQRDLIVLFILSAFLIGRGSTELDLHLIFSGSLGCLVGEVVNGLFFYRDYIEYLSYDSLKVFVIFPLVYALLTRKNIIVQVTLATATLYIIFMYGTRMITLSMMMLFLMGSIIGLIRRGHGKHLLVFFIAAIFLLNINFVEIINDSNFARFKAISFIGRALENFAASEFLEVFVMLDPIRFSEYQLFFERQILEVIFGSGLGSGLYDANGALAFVGLDWGAFSTQELKSSTFYNFHDFWVDFGLRFGIAPIIYLVFVLVLLPMWRGQIMQGILFGLVILNATFATAGIIFMALLVRLWPLQSQETGDNTLKSGGGNA